MDVAVVGAGVAGCYCAYRLASGSVGPVKIYEASDRVGGRLWSLALEGSDRQIIELGGTFFSTLQANVHGLITKELGLPCTPVKWTRDRLFFRGRHLSDDSFDDAGCVPFSFDGAEAGRSPHAILDHVLARIVPNFADLWPVNQRPPASSTATYALLQALRHRGRPLHQCGFWNVLSDVASNEAYELLTRSIGSISVFRNANAFDAIWNLLHELAPQDYFRVDAGYQSLAETLWILPGAQVGRHLEHRLTRIDRKRDGFALTFETPAGQARAEASHVILALPQHALQSVTFGESVLDDPAEFARVRDSVHRVAACKIFMTFDAPWWTSPDYEAAAVRASYTDLPLQQCYCFGGVADAPALMMASFADDVSVPYWTGLGASSLRYPKAVHHAAFELECSKAMVDAAVRQLSLLHDVEAAPAPIGALFVDWERYGGGWHAWRAGARSWRVRDRIRTPCKNLFVCGEAYAERHGWVEGALNSAEMVVQHFGVGRPSWVDSSYEFEHKEGEYT